MRDGALFGGGGSSVLEFCNDRGMITDGFGVEVKGVSENGRLCIGVEEGPGGEGGENAVDS